MPISNKNGCKEFKESNFDEAGSEQIFHTDVYLVSTVLMLDRGQCTFVEKVRNAQKIGVKFVVIADNILEESEDLIMTDSSGNGETITISSMMIRKKDAELIEKSIADKNKVIVKIDLEFAHNGNGKVDIDFW
eukprot:CAMPEP_0176379080 /NCGR_PEP_ID=MMETSP0126-20121128/30105_1 /TAXON_ID=141414 ORGANISM="Strombidinopsis acuminatum, Strain SPMC142" /NCGR_SAMPLE_ID=MMETSP0126 /ASSEMBLY_ACC=CAM_ASM_000229 /LENGTH=132 /DNA_ID=CAMNT_0017741709 /DNA_START=196 /DNA_END=591 /DNA_ORIENTATION=+